MVMKKWCWCYRNLGYIIAAVALGILLACILPLALLVIIEAMMVLALGWLCWFR